MVNGIGFPFVLPNAKAVSPLRSATALQKGSYERIIL
jgi:hypothetical protein